MSKKITLVLSAGGSWGVAHLGVMEILKEEGVPIGRIVGVSTGAFFGGLVASGADAKEISNAMRESRWAPRIKSLWNFAFSLKGVFRAKPFMIFLRKHLKKDEIEEFPIKFAAIAAEVTKRSTMIFDKGSAFDAIQASIAMPGLIRPVERDDGIYVDGAYVSPLPVRIARSFDDSLIIAVDIQTVSGVKIIERGRNVSELFQSALALLFRQFADREAEDADIVIKPEIKSEHGHLDFVYDETIVEAGRKAASEALPEIKKLVGL